MSKIRKVSVARRAYKLAVSMKSVKKKLRKIRHRREFPPTKFPKLMKMIRRENKRSGYDPATGTNWCHLPMEMRMMCIERMNFKTRCCLRGTSTIEKALVESEKYDVRYLEIDFERFTMESYLECVEDKHVIRNKSETEEEGRKVASLFKLVLKLCVFDFVRVRAFRFFEPEDFLEPIPFDCRLLELEDIGYPELMFFLDSCMDGNPEIEFRPAFELPLYQVISKSSVYTAKRVSFFGLDCACQLPYLFTHWMMAEAEIGTTAYIECQKGVTLQHLATLYGHGVLCQDGREMFAMERVCAVNQNRQWNEFILCRGDGDHSFRIASDLSEEMEVLVKGNVSFGSETVKCTIVAKEPQNAQNAPEAQ